MTQEQYEKCKEWEQQLRWAVKSNFVHMNNTDFSKVAAIYKEVFGEGLTLAQMTCNTCRLRALKRLGEDYFNYEQKLAQEAKEERTQEPEKKKVGRPKKINIDGEQTEQ